MHRILPFTTLTTSTSIETSDISGENYWTWNTRTFLMSILNATPDSFSDGGVHFDPSSALEYARTCVEEGVDIIDVGGYSTRPGALEVNEEEETRRVTSVVKKLREEGITLLISVDTFRSKVAEAALDAGANMINDVSALSSDPLLTASLKERNVPVVLMHSRGDAGSNKTYNGNITDVVRDELGAKVQRALDSGVKRWNLIVDPGIGFSKTVEGNCTLLRDHSFLTKAGEGFEKARHGTLRDAWEAKRKWPTRDMPTLVGPSRKSFIGKILGSSSSLLETTVVPTADRQWGNAVTVAAAIQQGADIVRVHDVREMRQVRVVADAIWRVGRVFR